VKIISLNEKEKKIPEANLDLSFRFQNLIDGGRKQSKEVRNVSNQRIDRWMTIWNKKDGARRHVYTFFGGFGTATAF
jgi:hypothetical protein